MVGSFVKMRQCNRKNRYVTEKMAKKVRNQIKWERKQELAVYGCTLCGGYHLTKNMAADGKVF